MIKQEATYFLLQHKVLLPVELFLLNNDTYRKVCIALHTHTHNTQQRNFFGGWGWGCGCQSGRVVCRKVCGEGGELGEEGLFCAVRAEIFFSGGE